jgi:hypothetical protein
MFRSYLERSPKSGSRVVPAFLIGAHAVCLADRLLARDRGYDRDYFKKLRLLEPAAKSKIGEPEQRPFKRHFPLAGFEEEARSCRLYLIFNSLVSNANGRNLGWAQKWQCK